MPRAFTDTERVEVRRRLHDAARKSLVGGGLRATSVGAVARAAGISKGAFYLFFASKEALVASVFEEEELAVRSALDDLMGGPEASVAQLIRFFFTVLDRHPVMRLLADADELALLFRSLPPEELAARMHDDDVFFAKRCRRWQREGKLSKRIHPDLFARIPRLTLVIAQQRAFIGEAHYEALTELLVASLAAELEPVS